MPTDEQLWYRMMSESSKKDPLIEARKKAQQEDIEAAKAEEQSFASKVGEMIMPPRPLSWQESAALDMAKIAEGTSHIPGISYIDDEEFEPLEVKPTPQDMRHARWQQLPHNVLLRAESEARDRLTPEDPEKVAQIAGIVGETAAGFTPAGVIIDIKDMAKAVETKDPILGAMAGVGLIPGIGDIAKGTFKSLKAGDRSAETVRVGRQFLEEAEDAERQWLERGTDSPYFQRWFGESAVTAGPEAKPIVVYHGTPHGGFKEFQLPDESSQRENYFGSSAYFTSSPKEASAAYADIEGPDIQWRIAEEMRNSNIGKEEATKRVIGEGNFSVMPTYLRIEKPFYMDPSPLAEHRAGNTFFDKEDTEEIVKAFENVIFRPGPNRNTRAVPELKKLLAEATNEPGRVIGGEDLWVLLERALGKHMYGGNETRMQEEISRQVIQELGFDGIITNLEALKAYRRNYPKKGNLPPPLEQGRSSEFLDKPLHYMVFEPEQIKSATGNRGTFDPSNPDITAAAPASLAGALDDSSIA